MDEVLNEFITEGEEIIHRVSDLLQKIEKQGCDRETIGAVYRDVHTLKGNSQLFGFTKIARLSHAMEASLDPIRKNNIAIKPRLIESSFKSLDLLLRMLKGIPDNPSDSTYAKEVSDQVAQLMDSAMDQFQSDLLLPYETSVSLETDHIQNPDKSVESIIDAPTEDSQEPIAPPVTTFASTDKIHLELVKPISEFPEEPAPSPSKVIQESATGTDHSIRVSVSLLDKLMNLVGELVLIRNQFLQYNNKKEDIELMMLSKGLDGVVTDLQTDVMLTRMQPISTILSKYQRLVRDTARQLGKRVDLTLEGSETELDKTILEAIRDPLTHLVRNACDHGIEEQDERRKNGKPENGHIMIRSYHESGHVVIEISDDGRGLDAKKIKQKALEKGLISREIANRMQEREIFNLIFLPGFSTVNQVTSVSGRGVGMDVVKTNIEKAGGTVELSSIQGKSTTVRMRIPLTLAIVPSMLVRSKGETYAIPQVKLIQLVRIEEDKASKSIEYLQGKPVFRLRENLLPLIDLRDITGQGEKQNYLNGINIVVLSVEKDYFGLIVDEILDTTDIVVKPLSHFLKSVGIFSGATILGNGEVSLILDITGIATHCKINTKKNLTDEFHLQSIAQAKAKADEQEFLLFNVGSGVTHGIPLCLVNRLEEFEKNRIQFSGEQRLIRYRESLLPILDVNEILKYRKTTQSNNDQAKTPIIVVEKSGKSFGLEVNEIVDIITFNEQIDDGIRDRPGLLGNIIHQGQVITIVDALGLIEMKLNGGKTVHLTTIEELKQITREIKNKKPRILFADDVVFFRRHVSKVLSEAGYDVTLAEDGARALEILESSKSEPFHAIISDIEMPKLNGLELAREIRKRDFLKTTPLIALSTRFRDRDVEDGISAGFDTYLEKLNPEKLLSSVSSLLGGAA